MANAELDHFENEEAFVCPIIGEKFSEEQQLSMVKALLIDPNDDDPSSIPQRKSYWPTWNLDSWRWDRRVFSRRQLRGWEPASSPSLGRGLR